jgi:hypothetical protein
MNETSAEEPDPFADDYDASNRPELEMERAMRQLDKEMEQLMFTQADTNRDGLLSPKEFVHYRCAVAEACSVGTFAGSAAQPPRGCAAKTVTPTPTLTHPPPARHEVRETDPAFRALLRKQSTLDAKHHFEDLDLDGSGELDEPEVLKGVHDGHLSDFTHPEDIKDEL